MPDELVVVQTFQNALEAQMAKGRLESEGIKAFTASDDCAGMQPQLQQLYGVKLLVFVDDLEAAREILEIDEDSPHEEA
jgi:hypothetical protein